MDRIYYIYVVKVMAIPGFEYLMHTIIQLGHFSRAGITTVVQNKSTSTPRPMSKNITIALQDG